MVVHDGRSQTCQSVVAVINPVCGDKSAVAFFNDHVAHKLPADTVTTTERNASDLIQTKSAGRPLTVILVSGDGTLQEILSKLSTTKPPQLNFVLIPCGTANALYASLFPPAGENSLTYRLQSLQAFLDQTPPRHLALATTTISSPSTESQASIASVVVSTSLHAAILHDSEVLREQYPGVDRFKIAAHQNTMKWYKGRVKLIACPATGTVQIYDRKSKSFVSHGDTPSVHIDGPFGYFLSTFNVDRLEPTFRIAPLIRSFPPAESTCDIVVIRPLRDPSVVNDSPEARFAFVPKTWQVFTAAYQDGTHIQLAYTADGHLGANADGPSVVEYFRCAAWEWTPDPDDADAHLICVDGAISRVPRQGKVSCAIDAFKHQYSVHGQFPNL